jgi:hypothetical protein
MSKHTSHDTQTNEWLTPPEIISALGEFDLDPCSPVNRPWDTASKHYTIKHDGLSKKWVGRVWLNPPYGYEAVHWLKRLCSHGDGIALIFARTETRMFFKYVWNRANAVFFFKGRLCFYKIDGSCPRMNSGAPSCLAIYGWQNVEAVKRSGLIGKLVLLRR